MSVTNWYQQLPKDDSKPKRDKNFKSHLIEPCSQIVVLGNTGCGKTNSLIDFLSKKNNVFCDILIFSGSTTEEPLYQFLKEKIPEIKFFNDINEVPELSSFEEDAKNEKLIVFDDFINLKANEFKKIKEYSTAGRKLGFTCFYLCQNYTSVPKVITRNAHYFIVFKMNDQITINNILRNHNIFNLDKDYFKECYTDATKDKLNFFLLDLKNGEYSLRHNWTDIYPIEDPKPSHEYIKHSSQKRLY